MHAFHRTIQVQDSDQSEPKSSSGQTQLALNPSNSLSEKSDVNAFINNKADADMSYSSQDKSAVEQDLALSQCRKAEAQDTSRENQIAVPVTTSTKQEIPSAADTQENFVAPLSVVSSIPSLQSNLLTPFIPTKSSSEEEKVVSNLIQFVDDLEANDKEVGTDVVPTKIGDHATPSPDIQVTEGTSLAVEMKLSNVRQPSLESDQSAVVCTLICVLQVQSKRKIFPSTCPQALQCMSNLVARNPRVLVQRV